MLDVIVRQNDIFGWDVLESDDPPEVLFSGDRIRAEGFARQLCAHDGGHVRVVGLDGVRVAEYDVHTWAPELRHKFGA